MPRYVVTYTNKNGFRRQAFIRIDANVSDKAADAKRQIIGNGLTFSEVISIKE